MAINPKTRYPTKFGAISSEWPQGEPKNIAAAGDGTGSPWIADVVKDIMGPQQAILLDAGMTPADIPETALVSEYVEAQGKVFGRVIQATTSILTTDLRKTHVVTALGYAAAGDGGDAVWVSTGVDVPGAAGTSDFAQGKIYDSVGREFSIIPGPLNPRAYGAKGDGSNDDTTPINQAILTQNLRGGGEVKFSAGTYRCTDEVTLKDKVWLTGSGAGITTLSFSGATPANFTNGACIYGSGTYSALPALSADVAQGDVSIMFASNHGLGVDDLFAFVDPRNFSFSPARDYYRAGEFCTVAIVTSNVVVEVTEPLTATNNPAIAAAATGYTAADVGLIRIFPIRCAIRDLTVVGVDEDDATVSCIEVSYGRECTFEGIRGTGSALAVVQLDRCFDCTVHDIYGFAHGAEAGLNYIVSVNNSQLVYTSRLRGGSTRHAWTNGGNGSPNAIPNRFHYVTDVQCADTTQGVGTVAPHGNSEFFYVSDSTLWGYGIAGNFSRISDCVIFGQPASQVVASNQGSAIGAAETHGWDHEFVDCQVLATVDVGSNRGLVFLSDTSPDLYTGGVVRFTNVVFDMQGKAGFVGLNHVYSTTIRPELEFNNCRIKGTGASGCTFFCIHAGAGSSGWARVAFNNVEVDGAEIFVNAAELAVFNVQSRNSPGAGVRFGDKSLSAFTSSGHRVIIDRSMIRDAQNAGILIEERQSDILCRHTESLANNQSAGGLSNSSLTVLPAVDTGTVNVALIGNVFGDDQVTTTQSRSHYIADADELFEVDTTRLGGKTVFTSSVTVRKTKGDWVDTLDQIVNTGSMAIQNGDISTAPTGAQSLVIGDDTSDEGIYLKSGAAGNSRIVMGDGTVANRFQILLQHASNRALFAVNGTTMARLLSTGIHPWTDGVDVLGSASLRWGSIYGNLTNVSRLQGNGGTALVTGDVASLTNWGTGAAVTAVAGTDAGGRITITAGTGAGANPTAVLTWTNGAWAGGTPIVVVSNRGTQAAQWSVSAGNSTTLTFRFDGTPTDSQAYIMEFISLGV